MKKINTFLETRAGDIALGLGITGLIAQTIYAFVVNSKIVGIFTIIYFSDPLRSAFRRSNFYIDGLSVPSLLFMFMLVVGGYHYKKSKGIDARLMKFGFSIMAVNKLLLLITAIPSYLIYRRFLSSNPDTVMETVSTFDLIYPFIIALGLFYVSFHIARWLIRRQEVEYTLEDTAETVQKPRQHSVPKIKRFVHLIIDLFLMFLIVWPAFSILIRFLMHGMVSFRPPNLLSADLGNNLVIGSMAIVYYLIFEGMFHATPVKFLTGTRVVDAESLAPPTFGAVFARSLCRRIPFNAFSFLGKKGWHDSISGTELILEKKEGQIRFKHWIWILLLVGGYVSIIAYSVINEYIEDTRKSELLETADAYRAESTLAHLSNGDLLLFKKQNGKYRDDQTVVLVSKVTDEEVTGIQYQLNHNNKTNRSKFITSGTDQNWKTQDQVSISKSQLTEAFRRKGSRLPVDLNGKPFVLESIEDINNPVFNNSSSRTQTSNGLTTSSYFISYDTHQVDIIRIELLEGEVDWKALAMMTDFNLERATGFFQLEAEGTGKDYSKSRLRVRYAGQEHDYLVFKYGSTVRIVKEMEE